MNHTKSASSLAARPLDGPERRGDEIKAQQQKAELSLDPTHQQIFDVADRPPARVIVVSAILHIALTVVALFPLYAAYQSSRLFTVGIVAACISGALTLLAVMRRIHPLYFTAIWLIGFCLTGVVALPDLAYQGVLPSGDYLAALGRGTFTVWKQVLTIEPPFEEYGHLLLLPFLLAWFGAFFTVFLATMRKKYQAATFAIIGVLLISILFSTHRPTAVVSVALSLTISSVSWLAWRQGMLQVRRIISLTAVLAVATASVSWVAQANVSTFDRLVLRDYVQPPVKPFDYPSPLAGYRQFVDQWDNTELFHLTNLPTNQQYVRLAAMDAYDGRSWSVSGQWRDNDDGFAYIGEWVREEATEFTTTVTVQNYSMVWLPNLGGTVDVKFGGQRADTHEHGLYYNRSSETGIVDKGLREGDIYELSAFDSIPQLPEDTSDLTIAQIEQIELLQMPSEISQAAQEYIDPGASPFAQIRALEQGLAAAGGFSHGLVGEMPSMPGHGLARLLDMVSSDLLVGDAEQYAALMALMVRSLGYPSRVVMGFEVPDDDATIFGSAATAWVEVPFAGIGWIPFFPTPDADQRPTTQWPDEVDEPEPQVIQPPELPTQVPAPVPQEAEDVPAEEETLQESGSYLAWIMTSAVGIPLVLLVSILVGIVAAKRKRRRRRSTGSARAQTIGAWDEYIDRMHDIGEVVNPAFTRQEAAKQRSARVKVLATSADRGEYGAAPVENQMAQDSWRVLEEELTHVKGSLSKRRKISAMLSIRSLRKKR